MDVMGVTPLDAIAHVSKTKDYPMEEFKKFCQKNGLRIGQAWMTALSVGDSATLVGSYFDPYYADNWASVCGALCYLIDPDVDKSELRIAIDRAAGTEK